MSIADDDRLTIEATARCLVADGFPLGRVTAAIEGACNSGVAAWDEVSGHFVLTRRALLGMWQELDAQP
jgi:hypothetical protein